MFVFFVPCVLCYISNNEYAFLFTKGMSHLWNIPDSTPEVHQEMEIDTWVDPMEKKMEEMVFTENNCNYILYLK